MNGIESIVVLKDAASAAIYGAQSGAGGVVLVTTKKAKQGAPSLTYDGTFGIRQATNLIEPLNAEQQIEMRKISHQNAGLSLPVGWDVTKNPWIGTTRTDWMDEIFRTAFYQRHNVALNVGSDNFSNRISFAYDNDEGVLINTFKKNLTLRYNGKMQLNKWVSVSEDFVWQNTTQRSKATDNDAYTGPILSAIYMPASATVYNPLDGSYGGVTTEEPAYIEKSMAVTYEECTRINVFLRNGCSLFRRILPPLSPLLQKVKEMVENGSIGNVINVQVRFAQPPRDLDYNRENLPWRVQADIAGGGYFYDLAPHQIDLLQDMFGCILEASGYKSNRGGFILPKIR